MKMFIFFTLVICLSLGNANALTVNDLLSPKAQKMILPCVASMAVGQVLGEGVGVGLAVCAGAVTYTMVNDHHNGKDAQTLKDADRYLKEAQSSLTNHLAKTKEEYDAYREAVRKIILEKLSEIQAASESQVEIYMKTPAFEAFLKKKTEEVLSSSDDILESRLRKAKEEIRLQVTEEVLKDVLDAQVPQ